MSSSCTEAYSSSASQNSFSKFFRTSLMVMRVLGSSFAMSHSFVSWSNVKRFPSDKRQSAPQSCGFLTTCSYSTSQQLFASKTGNYIEFRFLQFPENGILTAKVPFCVEGHILFFTCTGSVRNVQNDVYLSIYLSIYIYIYVNNMVDVKVHNLLAIVR